MMKKEVKEKKKVGGYQRVLKSQLAQPQKSMGKGMNVLPSPKKRATTRPAAFLTITDGDFRQPSPRRCSVRV